MYMNLLLRAGGDTVCRKCPYTPDTSVVKSILDKPESPAHVSSRTQLQNPWHQIRRSNQVSIAENYPRRD
ncbi:hypothetical protein N7465_003546 [Penicillium sp. CMV-2018d]|nr:hypothetical protein N7465_003546 [Penicillium sp. CMV-2018d]